jgi:hypothetical protein
MEPCARYLLILSNEYGPPCRPPLLIKMSILYRLPTQPKRLKLEFPAQTKATCWEESSFRGNIYILGHCSTPNKSP